MHQIEDCRVYLAKDGTEIQDEAYFETIEPQTLFVIASAEVPVKTGNYKIHGRNSNQKTLTKERSFLLSLRFIRFSAVV